MDGDNKTDKTILEIMHFVGVVSMLLFISTSLDIFAIIAISCSGSVLLARVFDKFME